jgi:L-arabinose isomerase
MRPRIDAFYEAAAAELEKKGIEIIKVKVCRIEDEFKNAIKLFEESKVDAVITLHLAYSPSLESITVLSSTKLPLVIMDTTPTYDFNASTDPDEISYNHGIHGVQDLCNMLKRYGKGYQINAGHLYKSNVVDKTAECVKAAAMAGRIKNARVGMVGKPFKGMGDFYLPAEIMKSTIGLETVQYDFADNDKYKAMVSDQDIEKEMANDHDSFNVIDVNRDIHYVSTLANLMIRRWVEKNELTALTVNFLEITKASGIPRMPFVEASRSMARGLGYAGEGDALTAALVGALLYVFPETSFVEMFCPGWSDNTVFISHMGEMNINLTAEKPILVEKDFPYTDVGNPTVAYGRFKPGKAMFVNLAPYPDNEYALILAPVEMLEVKGEDSMDKSIHGWFRPNMPVQEFLEKYSRVGGTHHGAIVYGEVANSLEMFGEIMGWSVIKI